MAVDLPAVGAVPVVVVGAVAALVVWNLVTWAVYRVDKARARRADGRGRRIPERTLLLLAAAGGSIGALLAVYGHRQRHKARKAAFMIPLWLIVVGHLAVIGGAIALR